MLKNINFGYATVGSGGLASNGTSLTVGTGEGAVFNDAYPGECRCIVWAQAYASPFAAGPANREFVTLTLAETGDTFTVARDAEDGGTQQAWIEGDKIACVPSAATVIPRNDDGSIVLPSIAGELIGETGTAVLGVRTIYEYDEYTKLLLHMDGTTFTDVMGHAVTRYGNAQVDTAQSKFGGASGLFDGTGDYLLLSSSADWTIISADFTIDFWAQFSSSVANQAFFEIYADANNRWSVGLVSGNIQFYTLVGGSGSAKIAATAPTNNTWHHIALVKSSGTFALYVDGIAVGTSTTTSYHTSLSALSIARAQGGGGSDYSGWIDEFRLSAGIARWTANFTPPASAYAPDSPTDELRFKLNGVEYAIEKAYCAFQDLSVTASPIFAGLSITGDIYLPQTTHAAQHGIMYKNSVPFIHDFSYGNNGVVTPIGNNLFIGINSGNFTMGSTANQAVQGSYNLGLCPYTLHSLTTGYANLGVGYLSLYGLTTGAYNLALGYSAGAQMADATLNQTSMNGLYLGTNTKASAAGAANEVVIGNAAVGGGSNTVVIGGAANTKSILQGVLCVGQTTHGGTITKGLCVGASLAPTTSPADVAQACVRDIISGNAAWHFYTETLQEVKLYSQAHIAAPSGGSTIDAECRDAVASILTLLQNNGLMLSL